MLIKSGGNIPSSEITPYEAYLDRRRFLSGAAKLVVAASVPQNFLRLDEARAERDEEGESFVSDASGTLEKNRLTSYDHIASYNVFSEFGSDRKVLGRNARQLRTTPWSIAVEGHIQKPATYDLADFIRLSKLEDRVYRFRCVEGWSMVIPWRGFPLLDLIRRVEPTGSAKYVEFTALHDPQQMPGQRQLVVDWPYVEGLRLDEAMHPLTLMATGLYGRDLPNQNGAPLRLIVPWKYGFKSIKSIVRIRFVHKRPLNTWQAIAPLRYGFYANVNPTVNHGRWNQAWEHRIGEFRRQKTIMFNGYAEEVSHLYDGMNRRYF